MALKGLKKADQDTKQQDIDNFISGASKRVKTLEKSQQKYFRLTFINILFFHKYNPYAHKCKPIHFV